MRKWIKRLGIFLAVIVLLIAALILFLHTPWGKSIVRNETRKYLVTRLKTSVEIGSIDYRLPSWIQINDLLVLDKQKDTLLYAGTAYVNMRMLKLLNGSVDVSNVRLEDVVLKISRESTDPHFNFQFIIDAFTTQNAKTDTASPMASNPVALKVSELSLNRIHLDFRDEKEKQYYSLQLGKFHCQPGKLALEKNEFNIAELGIKDLQFDYKNSLDRLDLAVQLDTLQLEGGSIDLKQQAFISNRFLLYNSSITYHNYSSKPVDGFDYNHMEIKDLNFSSTQNRWKGNNFFTQVDSCSLVANKNIKLKRFRTTATYTDSILSIKDLELALNQSALITEGELAWEFKPGKSNKQTTNCRILPSFVSYADILMIQPRLKHSLPVNLPHAGIVSLSGNLKGSLNNVTIDELRINSKELQFAGDVRLDLTNNKESYALIIDRLKTKKKILSPALLSALQKENIYLPEYVSVTGLLYGTFERVYADLKLNTDYGDITIKGDASHFSHPKTLVYNVFLDMNDFETGKWIGMDSVLGKVTGQVIAKGSGTKLSAINTAGELKIKSLVYNGYTYTNVDINTNLSESSFTAKGNIKDSNLIVYLDVNGNISGKYPSVHGILDIKHADLTKLGFSKDSITLSTRLNIDAPITDPKNLSVRISADSNVLVLNEKRIASDSIFIAANSAAAQSAIDIRSPLLTATINTNYSLDSLGSEMKNIIKRVNPFTDSVGPAANNHVTSIKATLNESALLTSFSPGLKLREPVTIDARFNAAFTDSFMRLHVDAPALSYNNLQFDQLTIKAGNHQDSMQLTLTGHSIRTVRDTFYNPSIKANWKNNLMTVAATIDGKNAKPIYSIHSSVQSEKGSTRVQLLDDLTLYYSNWEVPKDNLVTIKNDGLIFQHFSLTHKNQAIHISTKDAQNISPIDIRIDSFEIGDILRMVSFNDTAHATGILSAAMNIQQPIGKFPQFTGNAAIKKLAIKHIPVGDLQLNSTSVAGKLELTGGLKGYTNTEFSGNIDPANGDLNLHANIQQLDLKLVREFAGDFISRASGNISGDLHFTGTTSAPQLNGYIQFDTTMFALAALNTPYHINNQKIDITYPDLRFNNFSLSDTLGNKLSINGTIKMIDISEYALDVKANTKNFVALNAPRRAESVVYGTAILDIDLALKGTSNEPIIEGKGSLGGKSNVHYILESSKRDYTNNEKGMIRFVDLDTLGSPDEELAKLLADTLKASAKSFKGLKYNLNLEVSKDALFSILIDPVTGDELVIKGEANLNTGIAENGMMAMTGTYQLHSGHYKMNNKFLKGDFMLADGSTITFNGNPADAQANVVTEYNIDASPAGLLRPAEEQGYNTSKRLPFIIALTIKGSISAPELSFDIKLKEGATGIPGSLKSDVEEQLYLLRNDTLAMNKQVFSLLVMNQFTVYNTGDFASSDLSPDVALKQGMSQFLAEGMNEIAGNLIKGVDINVNMESYKTNNAQTRTDLGFEMSKNLMNDRLTVTVGKNFTMGEDAAKYQNSAEQYIPDVSTAYKLSKDGRYQVKAYRKNEYDAVVEGYFTETGVAFSIQLEYNVFKQIFQSQKKLQKE